MKNKVLDAIVSLLVLTGCGSMRNMSREDRAGVGAQIGAVSYTHLTLPTTSRV